VAAENGWVESRDGVQPPVPGLLPPPVPSMGRTVLEDLEDAELAARRASRHRDALVHKAAAAGCSWSQIAHALGRPRQNVVRKYVAARRS